MSPAYSRLLFAEGAASVYAFPGAQGEEVCTVYVEDMGDDYYAAATCADANAVEAHGLPLVVQRGDAVDALVLLPDSLASGSVAAGGNNKAVAERARVRGNVLHVDLSELDSDPAAANGVDVVVSRRGRSVEVSIPMGRSAGPGASG